jgi:GH15 family glucan-1,4-alpha-glucosidase
LTHHHSSGDNNVACKIEDYGLIGDCETAALIGRDGSIDWLCWPAFDSDACFAALLGTPKQGRWRIAPAEDVTKSSRRYLDNTLILKTRFETANGIVALIDFMPPRGELGFTTQVQHLLGCCGDGTMLWPAQPSRAR